MKKRTVRLAALMLAVILSLAPLCACDGCSSCGGSESGGFISVFSPAKEPKLMLTGSYPFELPLVYDVPWAESVNEELAVMIQPLLDALADANSEGEVAHTAYVFTPVGSGWSIGVYANGASSGSIHITEISLSGNGEISAPSFIVPDYFHDGAFLRGAFALTSLGLSVPDYDVVPETPEITELLVRYYEAYTGAPVDTSVLRWENSDEMFMKAVALGFFEDDYDYFLNYGTSLISGYARMLDTLFSRIYIDYLGRSSTAVTVSEFSDAMKMFFNVYFAGNIAPAEVAEFVSASDIARVSGEAPVTRNDAAIFFNSVYASGFRELRDASDYGFADEVSDDAATACGMFFMYSFPSSSLFSGDYTLRGCQLAETVRLFVDTCYWDSIVFGMHSIEDDRVLDNRSLVVSLGLLDEYLSAYQPPAGKAVVVNNSPSREWYVSQFNTGDYSAINCMPSISVMALNWYYPENEVSVEQLRDLFLEENDSGWYMSQVIDSLDHFSVPYTEWELTDDLIGKLTAQLDSGHIILTQMSEAAYNESGHCFVIYGYRKLGDSVQFMVHDPGIYDGVDEFGKPPGEAELLDGEYVEWIIGRIAYNYLAVGE